MKKITIIGLAFYLLISCSTVQQIPEKYVNVSVPDIGVIVKKNIGEVLIQQGKKKILPVIIILKNTEFAKKGVYEKEGSIKNNNIFKPVKSTGAEIILPKILAGVESMLILDKNNQLNVAWYGGVKNIVKGKKIDNEDFTQTEQESIDINSFQKTLIYTGKNGSLLYFSYIEFAENFNRPIINIDVFYDISESDILKFKEAEIEVINATGSSIEYRVLKNIE